MIVFFNEIHLIACVGELQGGCHACDTAPDHQHSGIHIHIHTFKGFMLFDPFHGGPHQVNGFAGCFFFVFVHPTALLADIGHLEQILVEPGHPQGMPEGAFVHIGTAGRHHYPVQIIIADVLCDHLLSRGRTHVFIRFGHSHIGKR